MIRFSLSKKQKKKLRKWKEKIKKEYGYYGYYAYVFTPTESGISIIVKSKGSNEEIDLSDYAK